MNVDRDDLIKAERFVEQKYKPAKEEVKKVLVCILEELGVPQRPTSIEKNVFCLSDFFKAVQSTTEGRISWSTNRDYKDQPYGRRAAEGLRKKLLKAKWLVQVQSAQQGLKAIYQADQSAIPEGLEFIRHHKGTDIKVRGPRTKRVGMTDLKGKLIPLKTFGKSIMPLADEMKTINQMMENSPLTALDGTKWDHCHRGFNEGRLDRGGRLYGGWQSKNRQERLKTEINGSNVCEIDIQACFLFLFSNQSSRERFISNDPYNLVQFVRDAKEEDNNLQRKLAKTLISAMFWKEGEMTQFPRGEHDKKLGRYVSLRGKYGLKKSDKFSTYRDQIYSAFPALQNRAIGGGELMFKESEIIVKSLIQLAQNDIPAYPVHDCLLFKEKDEDQVISVLKAEMNRQVGAIASLEVTYKDGTSILLPGQLGDVGSEATQTIDTESQTMDQEEEFEVIDDE